LANFSGKTRKKLDIIRKNIKDIMREAKEKISYDIPAFTLNGHLANLQTKKLGRLPQEEEIS